jgi:DNA-directed RNA polymerase alpha subunit
MTQAWDFVDAFILWQARPKVLGMMILDLPMQCEKATRTRAIKALHNDGIRTVADLMEQTYPELMRTPNLGAKSVNAIDDALKQYGLYLEGR